MKGEKRGICPATHQCKQRLLFQQRRNEDAKGCSTAAVRTDTLRHWYDTHTNTQKWEVVLWETAQSRHDAIHPRLSTVPNLTRSDVIGDGGFVYHIWRGSDTASLGIGRQRPSFTKASPSGALQTKRVLTGFVVQNKPFLRFLRCEVNPGSRRISHCGCAVFSNLFTNVSCFRLMCA